MCSSNSFILVPLCLSSCLVTGLGPFFLLLIQRIQAPLGALLSTPALLPCFLRMDVDPLGPLPLAPPPKAVLHLTAEHLSASSWPLLPSALLDALYHTTSGYLESTKCFNFAHERVCFQCLLFTQLVRENTILGIWGWQNT